MERNVQYVIRKGDIGIILSRVHNGFQRYLKFNERDSTFVRPLIGSSPHLNFERGTPQLISPGIILPPQRKPDPQKEMPFYWYPPEEGLMTTYQNRYLELLRYEFENDSTSPFIGIGRPYVWFLSGNFNKLVQQSGSQQGKNKGERRYQHQPSWRTLFGFQASHPFQIALIAGHIRRFILRDSSYLPDLQNPNQISRAQDAEVLLMALTEYFQELGLNPVPPMVFMIADGRYRAVEGNGHNLPQIFRNYPKRGSNTEKQPAKPETKIYVRGALNHLTTREKNAPKLQLDL